MRTMSLLGVLLSVGLVSLVSSAWALDTCLFLNAPSSNSAAPPATTVIGSAPVGSLIIIVTDVLDQEGNLIATVPGIRHRTNVDGSFKLRIATPRVAFGEDIPLTYHVRVRSISPMGENCQPANVQLEYGK